MDEFPICKNCGARIELIQFALGTQWMHWPTLYGNYQTNEKYPFCRTTMRAEPKEAENE